jgi:hypothetical protein
MTILRLLHIVVVAVLVLAAADVYNIKFGSTLEAQQVAKMRAEIRHERDAIAALRAQWTKLESPDRIETLTRRHLPLKPLEVYQLDKLEGLPARPPPIVPPGTADPIAAIIETDRADAGAAPSDLTVPR